MRGSARDANNRYLHPERPAMKYLLIQLAILKQEIFLNMIPEIRTAPTEV